MQALRIFVPALTGCHRHGSSESKSAPENLCALSAGVCVAEEMVPQLGARAVLQ